LIPVQHRENVGPASLANHTHFSSTALVRVSHDNPLHVPELVFFCIFMLTIASK